MIPPILTRIESLGHAIFTKGDWNLNIFGIRSPDRVANAFDDLIGCAYKEDDLWKVEYWEATTDPGSPYLIKPINSAGAAIISPGQYRSCYKIAKHRGKYDAICQVNGAVTVYRDDNRDNILDFDESSKQTGMFGINIHKRDGDSDTVNGASAGCQVFRYEKAFDRMMWLARKQTSERGWDTYTYTVMNEDE
jgi:hypothetical protein